MPDEIQNALTPEEWRAVTLRVHGKPIGGKVRGWGVADLPEDHQYAAMAVANAHLPDDDPRKITRAKIEKLRELVQYAAGAYTSQAEAEAVGRDATDAEQFLDVLAALLPPTEG